MVASQVLAFVDGDTVKVMLPAQDHKRLKNDDAGPNTGGMGAYCPCPIISADDLAFVEREVLHKAVNGFKSLNIKYCGVLYAGMMLTPNGPRTLEFNCRFGDPETQVVLPLLETDLYDVVEACCNGILQNVQLKWKQNKSAVGVVMASAGYPEKVINGREITGMFCTPFSLPLTFKLIKRNEFSSGLSDSDSDSRITFHSGTTSDDKGNYITNGGRVLIYVAIEDSLRSAANEATQGVQRIHFTGAQYRTDIAHKAFKQ